MSNWSRQTNAYSCPYMDLHYCIWAIIFQSDLELSFNISILDTWYGMWVAPVIWLAFALNWVNASPMPGWEGGAGGHIIQWLGFIVLINAELSIRQDIYLVTTVTTHDVRL